MLIYIENLEVHLKDIPSSIENPDNYLYPFIARHIKAEIPDILKYEIIQKSIDARKKRDIRFIYRLNAEVHEKYNGRFSPGIPFAPFKEHPLNRLKTSSSLKNPLIVGTGPAGLMTGFLLAKYGCAPIMIDCGYDVDRREKDISDFFESRKANTESNFLFGEGGAGAYSDGKLYTRVKDEKIRFVLQTFVSAGAPPEILYVRHPHIGSDILPRMIKAIRKEMENMGARFIWGGKVKNILKENGNCGGGILENGEKLEAPISILAFGLSARELIIRLCDEGLEHKLKDFQIGSRIEHRQDFINKAQYGFDMPGPCLGAAEYNFVSRPPESSGIGKVTSFCMCPGGYIIPAVSSEGQLSTNGMSKSARNGKFANSALIVNQNAENFSSAAEAFDFLNTLEGKTFSAGGSDFTCPAQDAAAFVRGAAQLSKTESSYKLGVRPERIDLIFPEKTALAMREALRHFEKIAPGFMSKGTLIGLETRVSSPVRFMRNPETLESSLKNLYIAGEGAGYAGGIISDALDGLRIAEKIIER